MLEGNTAMARVQIKGARAKKEESPTARPTTRRVYVSSPTVPGHRENLERVVDTVEQMWKRGQLGPSNRPHENERAYRAAMKLRDAYEVVHGAVGGAMDFDRVRGAARPGMGPPLHYLEAAQTLNDVRPNLYALDERVVLLVVCEGYTIERAAEHVYKAKPSRAEKEEIGRVLRQGLAELADLWLGQAKDEGKDAIVSHREPGATDYVAQAGVINRPTEAVHATGKKIFRK